MSGNLMPDRVDLSDPESIAALTDTIVAAFSPIGYACRQALDAIPPEFWAIVETTNAGRAKESARRLSTLVSTISAKECGYPLADARPDA
jgi:hypothetical protein